MAIIGISGKIGSGKDLSGLMIQYLTSEYRKVYHFDEWYERVTKHGSQTHSPFINKKFADKLKDIACMILNCTREQLEDRVFKETPLGEEWWKYKVGKSEFLYEGEESMLKHSKSSELVKTTPRLLLQLLGTECGRQILHPNIWLNSLMSEYVEVDKNRIAKDDGGGMISKKEYYKAFPDWVITDIRFPNEADAVLAKGGIVLRIERPKKTSSEKEHESETALDNYQKFTDIIQNNSTKESLLEKLKVYV